MLGIRYIATAILHIDYKYKPHVLFIFCFLIHCFFLTYDFLLVLEHMSLLEVVKRSYPYATSFITNFLYKLFESFI